MYILRVTLVHRAVPVRTLAAHVRLRCAHVHGGHDGLLHSVWPRGTLTHAYLFELYCAHDREGLRGYTILPTHEEYFIHYTIVIKS